MMIVAYILLGLSVGLVSGAMGVGGGVLLVPLLMWLFSFTHKEAIGTTLGVLVPPIGLFAAINAYKNGLLDLTAAVWIALSFAIGAYFGSQIMIALPKEGLRIFFGLMLIYIGFWFLINSEQNVLSAVSGLIAVGISLIGWFGLRSIGRRYNPRRLEEEIRRFHEKNLKEPDYYI